MGRKNRRNRHEDDEDNHPDTPAQVVSDGDDDDGEEEHSKNETTNFKDLDFAQRRELQRKQAAEKRKNKMKCFLCGKAGHVRRQCPGIADDGRGMSRYKGKSDKKHEKELYCAKKYGEGVEEPAPHELLQFPPEFLAYLEADPDFKYYDAGCDVVATIDYLRSGRGRHKISQKEALAEYQGALDFATQSCSFGGMISKTVLTKPNRPWIEPAIFPSSESPMNIYYVLGLCPTFPFQKTSDDTHHEQEVVKLLTGAISANPHKIIGLWSELNYEPDELIKEGCDQQMQLKKLRCCCEAAGMANVPLQVRTSPGASGIPIEQQSVAGTDYAKVLLDLQIILAEYLVKFPGLKIHLSCWSGRSNHMMSLLQAFPTLVLGMDGAVSFSKANHLHECAFEMPLGRFVLETATVIPSTVANNMGRDASFHSGWWPFVAEAIAQHKKCPISNVARAATDATIQLYPQIQASKESQYK